MSTIVHASLHIYIYILTVGCGLSIEIQNVESFPYLNLCVWKYGSWPKLGSHEGFIDGRGDLRV